MAAGGRRGACIWTPRRLMFGTYLCGVVAGTVVGMLSQALIGTALAVLVVGLALLGVLVLFVILERR